jgi:hypothetical protein
MALHPPIFPIDQPVMPEERQIGRRTAIDALEQRVEAAVHQWLIGPRRIGKTSVAKAMIARLRRRGVVALDVDLSRLSLSSSEHLAGELARQASAARAGGAPLGRAARRAAAQGAKGAAQLSRALAAHGFDDEGSALAAVASLLAAADDGSPGLTAVLEALALHARATDERVVILLDEIHLLGRLDGAEHELARMAREPSSPVVLVLAGSEESAVEALRATGRPFAAIGQELRIPEIGTADWIAGLRARFAEVGVAVATPHLFALVDVTDGHPRRTMLAAAHLHRLAASGNGQVTDAVLGLALDDARRDRSWT